MSASPKKHLHIFIYSAFFSIIFLLSRELRAQGNLAPTISPIPSQTVLAGESLSVSFAVSDAESASSNLVVKVFSNNQLLAPDRNLALSGTGTTRTIKILPSGAQTGSATVTLTVTDQFGTATSTSFQFQVDPSPHSVYTTSELLTIPLIGQANVYPSAIDVSGLIGSVTEVKVSLEGLSHTYPDDLDIMLEGPMGQRVMLLSDYGGADDLTSIWLSFADSAPALVNSTGIILSGQYKPSNSGLTETMPILGSVTPSTTLGVFNGTNPNGAWKLYIADDLSSSSAGALKGWTLWLRTAGESNTLPTISAVAPQSTPAGEPLTINVSISDAETAASNLVLTATSSNQLLVPNENLVFSGSGAVRTVKILPSGTQTGTAAVTLHVKDVAGAVTSTAFPLQVNPSVNSLSTSTGSLTIPLLGAASTYPSVIDVSGLVGAVMEIKVTLEGLSHAYPDDLDILLEGPMGQRVMLLSDYGGSDDLTSIWLSFADSAPALVNSTGIILSGQYKPSNSGLTETMPILGSVTPSTTLGVFNGTNPNGAWKLYIADDLSSSSAGALKSWTLWLRTAGESNTLPTISAVASQSTPAGEPLTINVSISDAETAASNLVLTATSSNLLLVPNENLALSGSGAVRTVKILPSGTQTGTAAVTLRVKDVAGAVTSTTFPLQVNPSVNSLSTSTGSLTIPLLGAASTYPSVIDVSGLVGAVMEIKVTLEGLSHAYPDDLDIMLEGPMGQRVMLLSDYGGADDLASVWLSFADAAPALVNSTGIILSGQYKPSNSGLTETMPILGSVTPSTTLGVFSGTNPNGAWKLYIADDLSSSSAGALKSWTLWLRTAGESNTLPTISAVAPQSTSAGEPLTINVSISDAETAASNLVLTATSGNQLLVPNENLALSGSGAVRTVKILPSGTQTGTAAVTLRVKDVAGAVTSTMFQLQVNPSVNSLSTSTGSLTIPLLGAASTYPSVIDVSGLVGAVMEIKVTLEGLSHAYPDDLDIMLEGPMGQRVMLLSDYGGSDDLTSIWLNFADAAPALVNSTGIILSGQYKPSNSGLTETMPILGSVTPSTTLGVFNGTNPNGAWKLYIADDLSSSSAGALKGWTLNLRTTTPPPPIISLSGDLQFANQVLGTSAMRLLTIRNSGNSTLNVSSISYPEGFSGTWSGSILPGGSQEVPVTFAPSTARSYAGDLIVNSDATVGINKLLVAGTGTPMPTRVPVLPVELNFGAVTVGASATLPLAIVNNGNSPLTIARISFPSGFSGDWSGAIAPGASQIVPVTFSPLAAMNYAGQLTIVSDATAGPSTVNLSGIGAALVTRVITLAGNLAFPAVNVGSTTTRTLTIGNAGNAPLRVANIVYPVGFSGIGAGTIQPGGSLDIVITFAPTAATVYGGSLTVVSDATSGGNTLALSGTGTDAPTRIPSLSGDLTFGAVPVGATAQRAFSIKNDGNSLLTIASIAYPVGFSGAFSGTIAPGASQNILVTFSPVSEAAYGGVITVASDATGGMGSINVSGSGRAEQTRVINLPASLSFGTTSIGATVQRTVTISNNGSAPLTITGISFPIGFSGQWVGAISAGASQIVPVAFSPLEARAYEGNMTVHSDATAGSGTVSLAGIGVPATGLRATIGQASGSPGSIVIVPVRVRDFKNILTFQFSLHWNSGIGTFVGVEQFALRGLDVGNFGTGLASQGALSVSWDDSDGVGKSVDDDAILFALRFSLAGAPGTFSDITVDGNPTPIEFTDGSLALITPTFQAGRIDISTRASLAGSTRYFQQERPVPGVKIAVTGSEQAQASTSSDGTFAFSLGSGGQYSLTPSKLDDNNPAHGITTADILLLRRHILRTAPLSSPYQLLAGDVNASGSVTSADIVSIRRMILALASSFPAPLWSFVPSDFFFADAQAPWNAPDARTYSNLALSLTGQDFIGIKRGDVNGSWTSGAGLASLGILSGLRPQAVMPEVSFQVGIEKLPNDLYRASILVSNFTAVTTVQFSLNWDPAILQFAKVADTAMASVDAGNFGLGLTNSGKVAFSWDDPQGVGVTAANQTVLFALEFKAAANTGATSIQFGDEPTVREVTVELVQGVFRGIPATVSVDPELRISSITRLSEMVVITWTGGAGIILQSSPSLTTPDWREVQGSVGANSVAQAITSGPVFYRLRKE